MKLQKIQPQSFQPKQEIQDKWSPSPIQHVDERWNEFKITGKNIISRSHHVSVIYKERLYIHGGHNTDKGMLSDFQQLILEGQQNFRWRGLTFNDQNYPGKLRNHSAVVHKNKMVIFGGQNEQNISNNNLWIYDFEQCQWTIQKPNIKIPKLDSHASVLEGSKMYVFGGFQYDQAMYSNTLYAIDLQTMKWFTICNPQQQNKKSPSRRAGMSMIHYQNCLWVFGGIDSNSTFNDFWKFDLEKNEWIQVISNNVPEARRSHSMIVYQDCFWMFGGIQDVTKEKNDINIFTPSTQVWTKIMNSSNLVYECSPTMKSKSKGPTKRKSSIKKDFAIKPAQKITLISANQKNTQISKPNQAIKRIFQENKQKKFMERKNQLLKEFVDKTDQNSKRQLSPISESMMKTLELIGQQEPNRNILHGEIMYDPSNRFIIGKKPCARDAHSCLLYKNKMLIFGGDRHLMCFSDLYYFDLKKGIQSKILYQRENVTLKKL